jgi:hypothetical protein
MKVLFSLAYIIFFLYYVVVSLIFRFTHVEFTETQLFLHWLPHVAILFASSIIITLWSD